MVLAEDGEMPPVKARVFEDFSWQVRQGFQKKLIHR